MDAATREILVGMKEQLSKGWLQGKLIFAIEAISEKVGVHYNGLAKWNDAPGRTVDDIVNIIDSILLENATIEETNTGKRAVHV